MRVERNNINWFLDLSEGIDLSIFIFGSSEKNLSKLKKLLDDSKDLIFIDIGANIGSTSLSLAQLFKFAKIYSFEPTFFAYKKFQTNLELNPNLAKRINLQNYLISNKQIDYEIYSSWKLDRLDTNRHKFHLGSPKDFTNNFIKLDNFINSNQISNVDFIKIDVDGNEKFVLESALETLNKFKPIIFIELAPYLYIDNNYTFNDLYEIFENLGYKYFDSNLNK